jgi:hypothetical protein
VVNRRFICTPSWYQYVLIYFASFCFALLLQNSKRECVQETAIKREEASFGRRSQRATRTNEQVKDEEKKEESKKAPTQKRSKQQQEGRPGKKARTEKTAGTLASLDAEDSLASASHPALEENEAQECKKKKTSASPQRYKRSPEPKLMGQSQATNTAGTVASPPKAASWSVSNIEKDDSIYTKEYGWVKVIGYSFSSNHPSLFQIKWKGENETILEGYVSEGNITHHIPRHACRADASDDDSENMIELPLAKKALRTADELIFTVNWKTTTLGGITMSVLQACDIEDGEEHYDYYKIIKERILELVTTGKVELDRRKGAAEPPSTTTQNDA